MRCCRGVSTNGPTVSRAFRNSRQTSSTPGVLLPRSCLTASVTSPPNSKEMEMEEGTFKYCCTRYQQKPVPVKWLKSYTVQDDNCNIRAIIFKTVKNRHICANPEDKWVNIAIPLLPR
uniref:Chemokine interleukin-8-like domain-containing protein n=1 Tax=Oreochromis aureus TaxID=47969 RepID=A0AAZ1Y588_OREAU